MKKIPRQMVLCSLIAATGFIGSARATSPMRTCLAAMRFSSRSNVPLNIDSLLASRILHFQQEFGMQGQFFVSGNAIEDRVPDKKLVVARTLAAQSWLLKLGISPKDIFMFAYLPEENRYPVKQASVWGAFIQFCGPVNDCLCPKDFAQQEHPLGEDGDEYPIISSKP